MLCTWVQYAGVTADDSVAGGNKFGTDPSTTCVLTTVHKSVDETAGSGDSYVYIANDNVQRNISCSWYV